jgi:hypothetical protein
MNRLTSGTASLVALLVVSGCNNDPTENLRNGITSIQAAPTTLTVVLGKTKKLQVTALDEQGNPLEEAYEVSAVGPGITVSRDSTFFPVFLNDTLLSVPPTAPTFQYNVTGTELVSSSFTVTAEGKSVIIPVLVGPDAANVPVATVTSTGPSASDQTVITAPDPYIFAPDAAVNFDAGGAIVLSISDDGKVITILPPPGAASKGIITGLIVPHLPQAPVSDSTDVALAIAPTVPSQPGTDDITTAPDITGVSAFYDGAAFTGADITGDGGLSLAQYYKFEVTEAGDYTFTTNWGNDADSDQIVCFDIDCSDGAFVGAGDEQPETGTVTLQPGTYYYVPVLFAFGASGVKPPWLSLKVGIAPPTPAE